MTRQVTDGIQEQGIGETVLWSVTLPHTPDSLTSVEVELEAGWTDVKASAMPSGSPSNTDAVVTFPALVGSALTENAIYRVTLNYVYGSNNLESFFRVIAVK